MQSVKLLPRNNGKDEENGSGGSGSQGSGGFTGFCAAVAFMDIKSAAKAHASENILDDRNLVTDYYEPLLHESGRSGGSGGGSVTVSGPPSRSNSRYPHDVDVVSSGYERPSSHFFERRGDRGDPDGSFLRRQGPLHYRDRPYRNGPFPQSMNERGPVGAGHAHFRSSSGPSPAWNSYESPGPPSSRYPPPDYMEERPERPDFGPSLNQNNVSNSSSKRTGPLPSVTMTTTATTTPLSARKRKSR